MDNKGVLNQSLGIDIAKDSFSSCFCFLNSDLSKDFELGEDFSNDKQWFIFLYKWIKKQEFHKLI
ncbi:MAG: hypothetical protein COA88_11605 [Kordia sp.]|nr:MAG: hypothetical protein COA88_11605 [Kordia sp.]